MHKSFLLKKKIRKTKQKNVLKEISYMFCGLGLDIRINIKLSKYHQYS